MLKYNPFNQELANAIDGLKEQVAQLRNDMEFLSASAQRADDRFGGGGGAFMQTSIAVPVKLNTVSRTQATGIVQIEEKIPSGLEWLNGIPGLIRAKNVLNCDGSPPQGVFHNLSLISKDAIIQVAPPNTNSGGIFHFVLAPNDVFEESGVQIDDSFCTVYEVTRNVDNDTYTWELEGEEGDEGFVPPDEETQQRSEYSGGFEAPRAIPPNRSGYGPMRSVLDGRDMFNGVRFLNGDEEEEEQKWKVQVFTYCKPDITVECREEGEEPEPEPDP